MYLSTKEIQEKYSFSLKDLFIHYTAVGGEIPSELITELGITQNNINYITRKSNFKNFFMYRKSGGLKGYQLQSKGIDYILSENKEYAPFVNMTFGKRKVTNDFLKRIRYQRKAWLYHYFDETEINYFSSQTKSKYFFYTSQTIKSLYAKFHNIENIREYEISGSRIYGTLKLKDTIYNVYVFDNSFDTLSMGIEYRTNALVSEAFKRESVETIIFARNVEYQLKILSEILNAMTISSKEYKQKQYSFFRNSQQNGLFNIHILSFDEVGKNQMELLKEKNEAENAIHKSLSEKFPDFTNCSSGADQYIHYDAQILNQPCFFLYSLDIYKIKQVYDIVTSEDGVYFYLVCFEKHISVIRRLFFEINVDEYVKFISIETLNLKF